MSLITTGEETRKLYKIDTEGDEGTDQVYDKIGEEKIKKMKYRYLFKWFLDVFTLEDLQVPDLIEEIDDYISEKANLEIFDRPQEIVDYLLEIKELLVPLVGKGYDVRLFVV